MMTGLPQLGGKFIDDVAEPKPHGRDAIAERYWIIEPCGRGCSSKGYVEVDSQVDNDDAHTDLTKKKHNVCC